MFANGSEDLGSIPGRVIPKTQKWYLMPPCLTFSIIRYRSRVRWSNLGKGVAPSPTPRCSSYLQGSLRVTLDYGRQLLYLLLLLLLLLNIPWDFVVQTDHSIPPRCLDRVIINEGDVYTYCSWSTLNGPKNTWKEDWKNRKLEEQSRRSRLQHCWDRLE